jgi:hypothetical protein
MAKKVLLVMVLAAIVAGGAFALDMSAGGGAFYAGDLGGGIKGGGLTLKMPSNFFGVYGFFDATYAEVSAGLGFGSTHQDFYGLTSVNISLTSLNFGLLGKYPININDKMTLFPAAGIEYSMVLSAKAGGASYSNAGDFSALWIKFGGGLDYSLTDKLFLRGTLLYGIRMANKVEKAMADGYDGVSTNLGHGPTLKVAVGYKF